MFPGFEPQTQLALAMQTRNYEPTVLRRKEEKKKRKREKNLKKELSCENRLQK